jgi:rhodanese-related sulfurtransferase
MAPFIPQGLINPELNLFFALILGLGFGYILEQAGFSSSRKLAGLFYGYDFVVLRVFFTAGVTAMTGLLFFDYLGWVDMGLVYVNPTFLWSAIVGGGIMGGGFIMGGFCPGTSLVGAVIGKIDAMVFIVGMFLGIFIFGHFYNAFEPLYTGSFLGNPFIYETLGMSKGWFALLLALMALFAFAVTQLIEDKVKKTQPSDMTKRPTYVVPALLLAGSLLLFLFLPAERSSSHRETAPSALLEEWQSGSHLADPQKVAYDIIQGNAQVLYIDLRTPEQYQRFSLPGAVHIPPEDILAPQWRRFFRKDPRQKVLYGDGTSLPARTWTALRRQGHENIFVLEGGLNGMFDMLFVEKSDQQPHGENGYMNAFSERFILEARQFFLEGGAAKAAESRPVPVRTLIEVTAPDIAGGC